MQSNILKRVLRSTPGQLILCFLLLTAVGILMNTFGLFITGSIDAWKAWQIRSYWYFFAWRVLLFSVLVWIWIPLRRRRLRLDPDSKARLVRAEIGFIVTVLVLELTNSRTYW